MDGCTSTLVQVGTVQPVTFVGEGTAALEARHCLAPQRLDAHIGAGSREKQKNWKSAASLIIWVLERYID
jgi:hypothetical protein